MVQAMAISHPPPSAKPLMQAITGLPKLSIRSSTDCPRCVYSLPETASCFDEFANVGASNEGLLTRSGQDGDTDSGVVLDLSESGAQLFHGRHVECVEHLGRLTVT